MSPCAAWLGVQVRQLPRDTVGSVEQHLAGFRKASSQLWDAAYIGGDVLMGGNNIIYVAREDECECRSVDRKGQLAAR
jgi:hypothetical protein